jgi:protein-S-isoprenylcysteine O-methyltransferase Ste14
VDDEKIAMPPTLWRGQGRHAFCLLILLGCTTYVWRGMGNPQPCLFWVAVAFPVLHQLFVWVAWRLELRSAFTSRVMGFRMYLVVFFVLFGGRFVSLVALAWFDRASLPLTAAWRLPLVGVMAPLGIYAMVSVARYFGMVRAAGADHFDPKYREMPLVKHGIYRFTSNGMYLYAFLLFWAIGMGLGSSAALVVAAFSHAYIWVHFYCVEEPDMDFLYSSRGSS